MKSAVCALMPASDLFAASRTGRRRPTTNLCASTSYSCLRAHGHHVNRHRRHEGLFELVLIVSCDVSTCSVTQPVPRLMKHPPPPLCICYPTEVLPCADCATMRQSAGDSGATTLAHSTSSFLRGRGSVYTGRGNAWQARIGTRLILWDGQDETELTGCPTAGSLEGQHHTAATRLDAAPSAR